MSDAAAKPKKEKTGNKLSVFRAVFVCFLDTSRSSVACSHGDHDRRQHRHIKQPQHERQQRQQYDEGETGMKELG